MGSRPCSEWTSPATKTVRSVCSGFGTRARQSGAAGSDGVSMSTELVEVARVLAYDPEQVWRVIGDPTLYPRFVREVAWSERVGQPGPVGNGARYRLRFSLDGGSAVEDEI